MVECLETITITQRDNKEVRDMKRESRPRKKGKEKPEGDG